jgi:hypothetical protein
MKMNETTRIKRTDGIAGRESILLVVLTADRSVIRVPRLATSRAPNMNMAVLTPNLSRIRSASPLRLMIASRMPISWVTPKRMVIGINRNRMGYPSFAPEIE